MSWNERKEVFKFNEELNREINYWQNNGMSEKQIEEMVKFMKADFAKRRNQYRYGDEAISLYIEDGEGHEIIIADESLSYIDDELQCPFKYGFYDERLQNIWITGDYLTKQLMKYIGQGYNQSEIATMLGVSKMAISKRMKKLKNQKN